MFPLSIIVACHHVVLTDHISHTPRIPSQRTCKAVSGSSLLPTVLQRQKNCPSCRVHPLHLVTNTTATTTRTSLKRILVHAIRRIVPDLATLKRARETRRRAGRSPNANLRISTQSMRAYQQSREFAPPSYPNCATLLSPSHCPSPQVEHCPAKMTD